MNHDAIYRSHSNVVRIDDATGAFDADGNQVTIDQSLVDAAAAEIATENAWSELRTKRNQMLAATDWEIVKHKELGTTIPAALKRIDSSCATCQLTLLICQSQLAC